MGMATGMDTGMDMVSHSASTTPRTHSKRGSAWRSLLPMTTSMGVKRCEERLAV
jgi:hypothetical protein